MCSVSSWGNAEKCENQEDDLSYITYYADNVAAAMDRREGMDAEDGFDKTVPLFSVFNILNGNHGHQHYAHQVLNPNGEINYPTENPVTMDSGFYPEGNRSDYG